MKISILSNLFKFRTGLRNSECKPECWSAKPHHFYEKYLQEQTRRTTALLGIICQKPVNFVTFGRLLPPSDYGDAFWDEDDLQTLCKPCHDLKGTKEGRRGKKYVYTYVGGK